MANPEDRRGRPEPNADPVEAARASIERYLNQLAAGTHARGDLEDEFVRHVVRFSVRMGISEEAWIAIGVPERVLERSGYGRRLID